MSKEKFLNYICYSVECPKYIGPLRWQAMLKWAIRAGMLENTQTPSTRVF